jgi:hypothetical protein
MVALAIGLALLAAYLFTLNRSRADFAAYSSMAGAQETARYALSVLVPDIEHAGFFGFAASGVPQLVRAGAITADAGQLRQPDADPALPVAGLPAGAHDCGSNFAVDLALPVQVVNNSFRGRAGGGCDPTAAAGGARPGSDTLTIRRASLETVTPRVGRLQVHTRRLDSLAPISVIGDGVIPGTPDEHTETRDLEVHTYYIANDSVGRPGWPALRVKALTESGGRTQFRDEEVVPGVEDLQVELAFSEPGESQSLRFGTPDLVSLRELRVHAVRLWLRVRADETESPFVDARPMAYADVAFAPSREQSRQRRLLVERTVALRNLRVP